MENKKTSIIAVYDCESDAINTLNRIFEINIGVFEIILVNNAASGEIPENVTKEHKEIKQIYLPEKVSQNRAKYAGLGIASGDYVYYADTKNPGLITKECFSQKKEEIEIKNNKLYNRAFLENAEEIADISGMLKTLRDEELRFAIETIKSDINKREEKLCDNIDGRIYNTMCRFDSLEKTFYEKEARNENALFESLKNAEERFNEKIEAEKYELHSEIGAIYDYINAKTAETNEKIDFIQTTTREKCERQAEKNLEDYTAALKEFKEIFDEKIDEIRREITARYNILNQNGNNENGKE